MINTEYTNEPTQHSYNIGNVEYSTVSGMPEAANDACIFSMSYTTLSPSFTLQSFNSCSHGFRLQHSVLRNLD